MISGSINAVKNPMAEKHKEAHTDIRIFDAAIKSHPMQGRNPPDAENAPQIPAADANVLPAP